MIVDGIHTLRAGGIKHISLEVAANNEPAQALYRRFGFAPVAVRKNYYPVTGQDALVMWVYDIDSEEYACASRSWPPRGSRRGGPPASPGARAD